MQTVSDKWYVLYARVATAIAALLLVASAVCLLVPSLKSFGDKWELSYVTAALAAIQVIYFALFYKREARANSYWSATFILVLIQALNIINLIHNTGRFHSWYLLYWAFAVAMSGMFGNYAIVGCNFLVIIYFILTAGESSSTIYRDTYSLMAIGGTFVISVMSYLVWKRTYVDHESQQVAQLSGDLKTKQQQTEIIIQSIADGMVVINTEGKINTLNPAASAMAEWPIEEAVGIDVQLVMKLTKEDGSEFAAAENPFVRVLTQKKLINETMQLTGRNGKQHIVSLVISPVLLPKSQQLVGAVALIRDISNTHAEEQRRADFISTASHEMRTPVAAIEGYLALALNDKVSQIDNKARDYLEKAHSSTQHLGKLFQDLLTSAKAEDGRLVSHPVVVEMGAFLEQLTDSLRFSAEKKGLLTEFIIGAAPSGAGAEKVIKPLYYVHVDPDRLREVITNLFDNAVKYTPEGKVSIGLTGNNEIVQLYIKDTGPGISSEDIPHLFQKFYRVDNSATRTIGGTGLGLFICRKIVELYKGRIWVESQLNHGSTFYINLPRLSAQKATELQKEEASQPLGTLPPAPTTGTA